MSDTTQVSSEIEYQYIYERPQVRDDFQRANEIDNCEDFLIKDGKKVLNGMGFGIIVSIPSWILIISFIIWVIP